MFINPTYGYYVGDKISPDDIECVSPQPTQFHDYDPVEKIWILNIERRRSSLLPLNPAQVRKVLTQFNLRAEVEAAVAAGSQDLKDEWQFRTEFSRDNVLLNNMAASLGISDYQLDNMFEAGILL